MEIEWKGEKGSVHEIGYNKADPEVRPPSLPPFLLSKLTDVPPRHFTYPSFRPSLQHALVKVDPQYFRPTEVELLLGDPAKAKKVIGYVPPSLPPSPPLYLPFFPPPPPKTLLIHLSLSSNAAQVGVRGIV